MVRDRSIAVLSVVIWLAPAVCARTTAQPPSPHALRDRQTPGALASASAAQRFREIAEDLARPDSITGPQADQAIVLLVAAQRLDPQAQPAEPLLLRLATRQAQRDYSPHVLSWLDSYVSAQADRAIVADAIEYLLDRQDSVEGRLRVLEGLVQKIGNRNAAIDSQLATSLGYLMIEKGDAKGAKFYLIQAYKRNKYNLMAFAKLAELAPTEFGPIAYVEHLRLLLREKPLDANAALNLAQYVERLQLYDLAAGTYQYTAELLRYLHPNQPLPPTVYLSWAIACYNTQHQKHTCLQIAETVRSRRRFDFLLEILAAKATAQLGNPDEGRRMLSQAEQTALQFIQYGPGQPLPGPQGPVTAVRYIGPQQMAWFYCFAAPNQIKALDWANKGYATEPNAPTAAALLAYALSMNGELEPTRPLLASFAHNQIAAIVQAQVQLADGDKASALATLAAAVTRDPGSLAAERAKEILREQGSMYRAPTDASKVMDYLSETVGATVVPKFTPPQETMELQFSLRGGEFAYGADLDATVAIVNKAAEPLIVTENGLFSGRIRVDAQVSGDLTQKMPNLVSETIRTALVVPAGRSVTTPVRLSTGPLRKLLLDHPQASLDIQFTLYVDPVAGDDGSLRNKVGSIQPVVVSVRRTGMDLSARYLRNRAESIPSAQEAQNVRTAQLFTGLLKEQHVMAQRGTLYAYRYADWMPALLGSALTDEPGLVLNTGDGDWIVRVNTMAGMLSIPIDRDRATAVARNLSHPEWPVRLMAVYLLAGVPGKDFDRVLDWMAQSDTNDLVRSMAIALRAAPPKTSSPQPGGVPDDRR